MSPPPPQVKCVGPTPMSQHGCKKYFFPQELERLYSTLIPLMSQHDCKKYFFPQELEGLYSTLITVSFVSLGDYVPPQVLLYK
jgi:hypothetical protein